jgi:flagellar motor switch protein FliN/FliY
MAENDTPDVNEGIEGQDESTIEEPSAMSEEDVEDEWAAAMAEQLDVEESGMEAGVGTGMDSDVQVADIPDLQSSATEDSAKVDLDMILDIPVTISMEIGRTKINIRNLLQLNQGSVVELDRFAGEPLDVFVNGTLIAHGEVVVVNEKFGIRLTDVISAQERIKKLK